MCLLILLGEKGPDVGATQNWAFFYLALKVATCRMFYSFPSIIFNKFPRRLTKN